MSPLARAEDLREWIVGRLDPLEDREPAAGVWIDDSVGRALAAPKGKVRPAAVLVGLIERPQGLTVLLTRRADTLRSHTGQIALPGGRRDPGETSWETALREAEEEVGLNRRFVSLAGLSTPMLTNSGYMVTPVVAFVREGFTLTPNPHEVADIFETPFGFLMDPANHEQRTHAFDDGQMRDYYAMTHEDRLIWGVTARILRALYERLYAAAPA